MQGDYRAVHGDLLVIDGLSASSFDEALLPKLKASGVAGVHQTVGGRESFGDTVATVMKFRSFLESHGSEVTLATTAAGIESARREGRIGVVMGFQGSDMFRGDESLLPVFHQLGVRIVQLAYNQRTWAGDGCTERTNCGLSLFGVRLVEGLNRLKMIVDCSHTGENTTLDAIEASSAPVIVSHTNVRALCDNPRGVSDRVIDAIATKGGVLGLTSFAYFLNKDRPATLADYLDNVDYLVRRVGVDHVGVGLDLIEGRVYEPPLDPILFKPEAYPPLPWKYAEGLGSIVEISNVTRGLMERDYPLESIRKIMGGNWLRVYREIWGE
jgi:membrane dipeptidase